MTRGLRKGAPKELTDIFPLPLYKEKQKKVIKDAIP